MSAETDSPSNEGPTEEQIIASMAEDDPVEDAPAASETASTEEAASQEAGEQEAEPNPADDPPEFWSAEKKALWAKITDADVRAAIRGHVDDASKAISGKMEEAAKARKEAEEKAARFEAERAQSVAWWQQAGPALQRSLQGKWAGWTPEFQTKLAEENPAEYTRLKAAYDADMAQFSALATRQQREAEEVRKSQEARHQQERASEHQKLATKYPAEFGDPKKAQETYDTLSKYLIEQGVPPERIPNIYEEPVVSTALKAYKYDQLQAKAKAVTTPKQAAQPASTTPRRVTPGAARPANQGSDSERQAIERLRKGDQTEDVLRVAFR